MSTKTCGSCTDVCILNSGGFLVSVFIRWNENLSDRRFVMDVDHVLTLHHSQVCVWVFATYRTWMQSQMILFSGK